jgi:hypothetical protein
MNVATMLNSDFAAGALSVLGLLAIKKIYDLYQYPTEANTQKLAKAPIPKIGDDSVITIWGFEPSLRERGREVHCDLPYVNRVEAYLCLKKVAYKKAITSGLQENPRKKVPFANVYGTMVDDSTRILAVLQVKLNDTINTALSDKQRAEGTMLELNVGSDGLGVTLAVTCDDSKWHVVAPRSSKRVSRMSKRNLLIRQ